MSIRSRDPHQPITAHLAGLAAGEARGDEAHQHEAAVTLPHHQRAAAVPLHRHTLSISKLSGHYLDMVPTLQESLPPSLYPAHIISG